jgi:hypothetical protein
MPGKDDRWQERECAFIRQTAGKILKDNDGLSWTRHGAEVFRGIDCHLRTFCAGTVVMMRRPRGCFGLPHAVMLLCGMEVADDKPGAPTHAVTTPRLSVEVGRQDGLVQKERIVARDRPLSDNRIAVIEPTY